MAPAQLPETDLAIVGAGVAACSLVATLRYRGWSGSITLIESGRGVGGRAATRRSRHDPGLQIDHGAPLFNVTARAESAGPARLLKELADRGWICPFTGAIHSLDDAGRFGPPRDDGFMGGSLWRGQGGMDRLAAGLLELAGRHRGDTSLQCGTVVGQLRPGPRGWMLHERTGAALLHCRWLVLSGTLLAHPRCQTVFGWEDVPLQQAAAVLHDPQLDQATAALAAIEATASSNLLLSLPAELAPRWLQQPWRLLQFNPEAQLRWGLRRVSLQEHGAHGVAVVAESSSFFAEQHRHVYGSRSSAAQLLGADAGSAAGAPEEAAVIAALDQALQEAVALPTSGAEGQLMRWGAALPQPPGLHAELQHCPGSRIGFCGDFVAGEGFGRVEGSINSAWALGQQLFA